MDTNATTTNVAPVAEEQPKKYIRTFAGDMATLKEGGTPDLSPLVTSQPESTEQITEELPVSPIPTPVKEEQSPLKTYAGDFSDKMEEEHASAVTVLAAEQDAAPLETNSQPVRRSLSGILYTIIGVILLVAGGFGIYFAYTKYLASFATIIFSPSISTPIFVDEREEISGVGIVLLQAIEQSVSRPIASGTIRLLYTSSATTTDNSVFSALQKPAPDVLLRNLNAKGSMAGIINTGGVQSPFFILSVTSYGETFSGMLSWERLMPRDLTELFPSFAESYGGQVPKIVATTTATTTAISTTTPKTTKKTATSTPTTPIITPGFRDEVIGNHDVRMYRDASGHSILLYGYWNQTTLIIARNTSAFTEILNRLANSRTQ